MSRKLVLPFFPVAPQQYDPAFMSEVIRSFSVFLDQYQNPGDARNTTLTLTNLQTDDSGLGAGEVFDHGGILRVPLDYSPYVRGSEGTGAVGEVTVTT
jgi:hypothetical protein